ncbi:4-hydroxy-tetrahydrodipicolinate reductase [Parolsenella catena]|uniref:4-hydroxy-tetrahydrodipicolinate reductase n=1 Tax=Parolsenella catena TaxID=2003188 RepID=A0A3G9JVL2_9ACTN|nr:4-hydroxy-tetrahydrodipicolinate reductase [Parolsenella catena]BBH49501.1 4-hydroxy-tetrahydrodipicolinate reductase [Parolsenella catena]
MTSENAAPIRVAIMGEGRMGSLIRSTAEAARTEEGSAAFEVVAQIGFDLSAADAAPAADVLIDFSNVVTLPAVASYVRRTGAALVSGTTGYTDEQMAELRSLAKTSAVLQSGNYSLGIAALRHAATLAARELAGFDVEIVETHHNQKVDAPSGTAKLLLDAVVATEAEEGRGEYHPVYGREGMVGKRDPREVGMHSLRGGTVAGVHTVSFFGTDEEVSLTHRATSRQIFVNGALAAARKMAGREPGFYGFDEVMFN